MNDFFRLMRYLFTHRSGHLYKRLARDVGYLEYGVGPGRIKTVPLKALVKEPLLPVKYLCFDQFYKDPDLFYKLAPFQSQEHTLVLCQLVSQIAPARLLEIGTNMGITTMNLHMNAPAGCEAHTVDVEPKSAADRTIREYFERHKIVQHTMKSSELRLDGKFDFIFLDGDHSYEGVKLDSELAASLISPRGFVVWDDYGSPLTPEVTKYLDELSATAPLRRIDGTNLVLRLPF